MASASDDGNDSIYNFNKNQSFLLPPPPPPSFKIFIHYNLKLNKTGSINIFHAKVYKDSFENALILPVKVLKGHTVHNDLGVLDIAFHPT